MSPRRWFGTTAALAAMAWGLWLTSPGPAEVRTALVDPQALVDRAGPDALLLAVVPVVAWACWLWGAVGLALTAASAAPGVLGRLAGVLLTGVLPAGARRAAATALGLGLGVVGPAVLPLVAPSVAVAAADVRGPTGTSWVDWPTAGDAVPDWPGSPDVPSAPTAPADGHVVVRGDCLWDIAADWLRRQAPGAPPTPAAVQDAVRAWWQANAAVIGPDPDLIRPGQVLHPPA